MNASEITYGPDIGCFVINRPMSSCKHCTTFCRSTCYNWKLYNIYKHMSTKDIRNETYWQGIDGREVSRTLDRKKLQTKRIRLMSRGEALKDLTDIDRIIDLCKSNPKRLVWLPTRAWRDAKLRQVIIDRLFPLKNLRLSASIDPSNTKQEIEDLKRDGFSTMFYGDDTDTTDRIKCSKTWKHRKGACVTCKGGCFSRSQKHVHLKMH